MLRHTWSGLSFVLIALGLAICTRPIEGQTMSFLRQFSTPAIDQATTVAAESSGIYVIGYSGRVGAGVGKYDSRGNELWTREFGVPATGGTQFARAAADATGVYVVVWASQIVRKYSTGGDELWTRQLEFRPLGGVTVDATGV